jgi:hypothetical protein
MADEDGAVTCRAGDYLIAFVIEKTEGMYALDGGPRSCCRLTHPVGEMSRCI